MGWRVCGQSDLQEGGVIQDIYNSEGQHVSVPRQPRSAGFPRTSMTHLSSQALKFSGFVTLKLLLCRISLGVVQSAAPIQTQEHLLNGLPSARALKQPWTSESTQVSWGGRQENRQLLRLLGTTRKGSECKGQKPPSLFHAYPLTQSH